MTREKMIQAVSLGIAISRGWYTGTVLREKQNALEILKRYMSPDEMNEFNARVL